MYSPAIQVQLKSSYSKIRENGDGSISYSLEVKNYKTLIENNRMIPQILVVFYMPQEEEHWIEQTPDWLKIKKCAFWISLRGLADTDNERINNDNFALRSSTYQRHIKRHYGTNL